MLSPLCNEQFNSSSLGSSTVQCATASRDGVDAACEIRDLLGLAIAGTLRPSHE
jgi:hypothetical protein